LFSGKRFVNYPDGSTHLHIEFLCTAGDGYETNNTSQYADVQDENIEPTNNQFDMSISSEQTNT